MCTRSNHERTPAAGCRPVWVPPPNGGKLLTGEACCRTHACHTSESSSADPSDLTKTSGRTPGGVGRQLQINGLTV
ncbi:hypothetical protein EVAR_21302_1 [Eumeta japonica]|uniref:Uncharacterized protein n=1 Tax=Eumeta variegata TaxID=151549 RepID=A0A4C1WLL9_EUMVA|nr:hypothetical protein EVAR_21302_1 [Eumeta japonica]